MYMTNCEGVPAMLIDRSPKGITRGSIVRNAVEIADADGLDAVTIRAVAVRQGSSPMSVYNHVADREDLLVGMLEAATATLPYLSAAADPLDRLTERYLGAHDHLSRRPWVLALLVRGDLVPTNSFALADACIGDYLACGLSPADAVYAHGVAWHIMLGEMLDRHPPAPKRTPTQRETALRTMDISLYPNYAHVISVLDPTDAPPACQFARTISTTLPGLIERLLTRPS